MIDNPFAMPANVDEWYAKGVYRDVYYEIPCIFDEAGHLNEAASLEKISAVMDRQVAHEQRAKLTFQLQQDTPIRDTLWVGGEIKRVDFTVSAADSEPLLQKLEGEFPGRDFRSNLANLIGEYDAYRPPYEGPSISWYEVVPPPAQLLAEYGVGPNDYPWYPWYGLKFDLTTSDTLLKIVFGSVAMSDKPKPLLPRGEGFYAMLVHPDGTFDKMVDYYVFSDPAFIAEYCKEQGQPFPCPDDQIDNIWLWGVTYNAATLEVSVVKGYNRVEATT